MGKLCVCVGLFCVCVLGVCVGKLCVTRWYVSKLCVG